MINKVYIDSKIDLVRDCLMMYGGLAVVLYKEEVDEEMKSIIDQAIDLHNACYGIELPKDYGEEALDYFIDSLKEVGKLWFNQEWTCEHALKNVNGYLKSVREYLK